MTDLQAGVTHDLVIYVNDSISVGLNIMPNSYRIDHIPTFIGQLSTGDLTGRDTNRWKSFVQQDFVHGAGVYDWSSPQGGAGFAESNLWDIAMPYSIVQGIAVRSDPSWVGGGNLAPTASVIASRRPVQLTSNASVGVNFSQTMPIHLTTFSGKPMLVHLREGYLYTGLSGPDVWGAGSDALGQDGLTGQWVPMNTSFPYPVTSLTKFSNVIFATTTTHNIVMYMGNNTIVQPVYNTIAHSITTYDKKLWRTVDSKLSYFDPGVGTWSTFYDVGNDPTLPVVSTKEFNGRLYLGKADGLYVFDGGRVYSIQMYENSQDVSNFKLLEMHNNCLYYNVGNLLFRLTPGGVIEKIRTPWFEGVIISGVSCGDDLIFLTRECGYDVIRSWIFNPETGGVRQWFDESLLRTAELFRPTFVGALRGHVFIAPTYLTGAAESTSIPVVACNRSIPPGIGYYYNPEGFMITSRFDMGLPSVDKQFNRVVIDHNLPVNGELAVSYCDRITVARKATIYENYDLDRTNSDYMYSQLTVDGNMSTITHVAPTLATLPWNTSIGSAGQLRCLSIRTNPNADFTEIIAKASCTLVFSPDYCLYTRASGIDENNFCNAHWAPLSSFGNAAGYFTTATGISMGVNTYGAGTAYNVMVPPQTMITIRTFHNTLRLGRTNNSGVITTRTWTPYDWITDQFSPTQDHGILYGLIVPSNVSAAFQVMTVRISGNSTWYRYEAGERKIVANWISLGTCYGDGTPKRDVFDLSNYKGRGVTLKFQQGPTYTSAPLELSRFEIEYEPVGQKYRVITATVPVIDGMERLDGVIENSLHHINATLWSIIESQAIVTVGIPYPIVGQTLRAQVSLASPGVWAPLVNHTHPEAEMSIIIKEF